MSNYQYKVNGVDYNVEIQDIENNIAHVSVNGKVFEIEMPETMKAPVAIKKEVKPLQSLQVSQNLQQNLQERVPK